jgi:uncharacterized protein GlcG (DUF336 family)
MGLWNMLRGRRRRGPRRVKGTAAAAAARPAVEQLEAREVPALTDPTLSAAEVQMIINRAIASNARQDAIVVVVDRMGRPLGVRVEPGVSPAITGNVANLVFSIDGALAEARTGAFFGNHDAPLTSRTIQFISQTTITNRVVNSNPDIFAPLGNPDNLVLNSPLYGPGLVAPVGFGGHFPPRVMNTPPVDLFGIEQTNRDSFLHPDQFGIKHAGQLLLQERFNVNPAFIPPDILAAGDQLVPPDSYGWFSGMLQTAQPRGIGTLPGGIPLYKDGQIVGGIGVFFPGTTGFASAENSVLSSTHNPFLPDLSLQAEFMAVMGAGISATGAGLGIPAGFLSQRITLAGIILDTIGPGGPLGVSNLLKFGATLGHSEGSIGMAMPVDTAGDPYIAGKPVPDGFLVLPHDGVGITAAQAAQIVNQALLTASRTRAQIRLPAGARAKFVIAVSDLEGNIVALFRQPDATIFSIDVAVAKARNVAYYASQQLQAIDKLPNLPRGVAFTNRTFRFLAQPRFPEGVDSGVPAPFSLLNVKHGITALNFFGNVMGHDVFFPQTNFHDPNNLLNQNGIVFFPGSVALYQGHLLLGGLGVSGDGVNQDDVTTFGGSLNFQPPGSKRADAFFFQGVRLPFINFSRNPFN